MFGDMYLPREDVTGVVIDEEKSCLRKVVA